MLIVVRRLNLSQCTVVVVLLTLMFALNQPAAAQNSVDEPADRIGAFSCLVCAEGGGLVGILSSFGRARREFGGFLELCVSDYRYIDGQLYVRFKLEGEIWPERSWYLQASSWEAVCKKSLQ